MSFRIREYHPADTEAVLELWDSAKSEGFDPVYGLAEVLASCQKDHAVLAVADEKIVGAAVARAAHEQGWIVFFTTLPAITICKAAANAVTIVIKSPTLILVSIS
jgi:hypothetical protein